MHCPHTRTAEASAMSASLQTQADIDKILKLLRRFQQRDLLRHGAPHVNRNIYQRPT